MESNSCFNRLRRRFFDSSPGVTPPRSIEINDPNWRPHSFSDNRIFTAKYTIWSFLPKFLFEQFMRLANFYFLVVSIIQMSSERLAPTGQYYTFVPLMVILALTGFKEILEDWRRHSQDDITNNRTVIVSRNNGRFIAVKWKNVVVGDIVLIKNGDPFPADLLLLSSSEPEALCYVETSQLDGETNLKIRQGVSQTSPFDKQEKISGLRATFDYEGPNNSLYTFEGSLNIDGTKVPIGPMQILLRGSRLVNTNFVFGLVVYTGHQSKLLMNARSTPIKKSRLEKMVNKQIIAIFGLLLLMAAICTVGFVLWNRDIGVDAWYLEFGASSGSGTALDNFTQFVVFVILFNTVVPISLYVSVEFVKFFQAILINNDVEMYYDENDTPAQARTSNLNEELGQIDFVFSDKTGTLTRNQMQFRKCSVGGIKYGAGYTEAYRAMAARTNIKLEPDPPELAATATDDFCFYDPTLMENLTINKHITSPFIREFLIMLAVCHTVIPERDKNDPQKTLYQAASPDEAALVKAAKEFGFYFYARKPDTVRIMALNKPLEYKILAVLEFNSTRKRMSVICRSPENKIMLYCKGADNVILERLSPQQPFRDPTIDHLQSFAAEGLRTLCCAVREIPPAEFEEWMARFQEASTTLENRSEKMDACAEEIERGLLLIGATAIEDRLQDGVASTIDSLLDAGIRVWMLTGDKKETAVNIGYCSQLIREDMQVKQCDKETSEEIAQWATETLEEHKRNPTQPIALVIDGKTLTYAFEDATSKQAIIDLSLACSSCICCRVSPLQKALVVRAVRSNLRCRTLAIGDGANDVTMIQTADVGVGITGLEGLQASRAADYSIGQFRFLKKLLLVHGTLSYRRLSKVILYSFYKTLTLYLVSFYFSFDNGFSGQIPWDKMSNALWNIVYTSLPVIVLGLFDQDVTPEQLMLHPQLYRSGQRNDFFKATVFAGWFINAIFQSLVIYYVINHLLFFLNVFTSGASFDLYINGTMLFGTVLLVVSFKMAFITSYWTVWNHVFLWCSLAVYYIIVIVCGAVDIKFYADAQVLFQVMTGLLSSALFYFSTVVIVVGLVMRDYAWKYFVRQFLVQDYHVIQEDAARQRNAPADVDFELGDMDAHRRMTMKYNANHGIGAGFAFSQDEREGSKQIVPQAKLTQVYDSDKRNDSPTTAPSH